MGVIQDGLAVPPLLQLLINAFLLCYILCRCSDNDHILSECCLLRTCRYYAAFPSLSDKCDLLAVSCSSSSAVDMMWSRVAQTRRPKDTDDLDIVPTDSGVNSAHEYSADDSGYLFCSGSSSVSENVPGNSRRHRRPRAHDNGRRRKPGIRKSRCGWASAERGVWPIGVGVSPPWLHDSYLSSYWPMQPNCAGFSQLTLSSDWLPEASYKDRFCDLGSSHWARPSFGESTVNSLKTPFLLQTALPVVESVEQLPEILCSYGEDSSSKLGNNFVASVDVDVVSEAKDTVASESTEPLHPVAASGQQLNVTDLLSDDNVGNSFLLHNSCLSFAAVDSQNPCNVSSENVAAEDDLFLGCRPFDPALWNVLRSARMLCDYSLQSQERIDVAGSTVDMEGGVFHAFEVGSTLLGDWGDVERVMDQSGCFDTEAGNRSLASAPICTSPEASCVTDRPARSKPETCTENVGDGECWDGSRIAEAMLENCGDVASFDMDILRQIWQPALSASCAGLISRSSQEEDSSTFKNVDCDYMRVDGHANEFGVRCVNKFCAWSDECHCVSCIWQSRLLSGDGVPSRGWTTHVAEPSKATVATTRTASSVGEPSIFWDEEKRDIGGRMKASSTWDSQLYLSDWLEPTSQDVTKPNNSEQVLLGDAIVASVGSSDDLMATKTNCRFSNLQGNIDDKLQVLCHNIETSAFSHGHKVSELNPDDEWGNPHVGESPCLSAGSSGASETRKFLSPSGMQVEPCLSAGAIVNVGRTDLTALSFSDCSVLSASPCHPVSSVLADLLEENNNIAPCIGDAAAIVACCEDCDEIVQLMPSLTSVSDIVFSSDTDEDTSELDIASSSDVSDVSVFTSPEPCDADLLSATSNDMAHGSLAVFHGAFDQLLQLELGQDVCSAAAQCYLGSFLAPIYALDGSALWFRDSNRISANIDSLSRLRSNFPSAAGWPPPLSAAPPDAFCDAKSGTLLLPSENTAFRDRIPQRLEPPLVSVQPITISTVSPLLHQSSERALSPWLWPPSSSVVGESLSVAVVQNRHQFRPIGTPSSTTDSDLSEPSADVVTSADSMTDFAALIVSDVLADSCGTYQRFVLSRDCDPENDTNSDDTELVKCRSFLPSFRVQCDLEKSAQTGDTSPPSDADFRLGFLVKQVLSQLLSEFPDSTNTLDDILVKSDEVAGAESLNKEPSVDEETVTMSRQLSVIWNDVGGRDDVGVDCDVPAPSDVSCQVSQIWADSVLTVTDACSPVPTTQGQCLSSIWSSTAPQRTACSGDGAESVLSGVPELWKDGRQRNAGSSLRTWKSVDAGDGLWISGDGKSEGNSIWSRSRAGSVAKVECVHFAGKDKEASVEDAGPEADESGDELSLSPSELVWGSQSPAVQSSGESEADEGRFQADGLRNGLMGTDSIWRHDGNEGGGCEGNGSWNVDSLFCSATDPAASMPLTGCGPSGDPQSASDPLLPLWIRTEANLDADMAFAFTHLVSGVVSPIVSLS